MSPEKQKEKLKGMRKSLLEKNQFHKYESSIYHKTSFHLKPLMEHPDMYSRAETQTRPSHTQSLEKSSKLQPIVPFSINIRKELLKLNSVNAPVQRVLGEDSKMLVTAKRWIIFDMENNSTLKGFKHKKSQQIGSLTTILTFYTAYMIIKKYYLSMDLDLMVVKEDEEVGGCRMKVEDEDMISLEDCMYGMMVGGANNAATILTNNLGSLVQKKREGRYFSCFDVGRESRDKNMEVFVELMKGHAEQLKLLDTTIKTPHGPLNTSTPHNIALLLSECLTIPLFRKVASTKAWTVRRKYINCNGQLATKPLELSNTNKLLWRNIGCIGGKTGSTINGGDCLGACFEGSIVVVVVGCVREEKFADVQKLIDWLYRKLKYVKPLKK